MQQFFIDLCIVAKDAVVTPLWSVLKGVFSNTNEILPYSDTLSGTQPPHIIVKDSSHVSITVNYCDNKSGETQQR